MKKYKIFKTAPHIYGHIFEHAIANRLRKYLINSDYLIAVESQIGGWTDDNIVSLKLSENIFNKLDKVSEDNFTENEIMHAINQICCEYKRTANIKNIKNIIDLINQINNIKWENIDESPLVKNIYEEDIFTAPDMSFSRNRRLKKFTNIYIELSLPEKYQTIRPLATYVFFVLTELLSENLNEKYVCYQASSYWNEWDDHTGSGCEFTFFANENLIEIRKFMKNKIKEILNDDDFINRLLNYLHKTENNEKYFNWGDIQNYSRYIVGNKGWIDVATRENFTEISKNLVVECEIKN